MAEFTPINTPEELDAALTPYKEKAAKYDELAAKKLDKQVEALQQQLTAKEQTIAELMARAETAEGAVLRMKVAHANSLPYEMAERLKGTTEEEMTADARELAKLVAPPIVAPLASTEPGNVNLSGADAAYMEMASALGGT